MATIRVTSLQMEMKERTRAEALDAAQALLDRAKGNDLILLPELWTCGYFSFDRYDRDAETIGGSIVRALQKKAAQLKAHILTGSFTERDGASLFNTTLLLDDRGQILARYRKIHLFGHQSHERKLLSSGTEIVVAETKFGPLGIATCYDLRFPEQFRAMIDRGARAFLIPSAWPYPRLEAWQLFNRARAHENLAYLFSCNCAGSDEGKQFLGHSMFVDPHGTVIASAGDGERLLSADVDLGVVEEARRSFTALDDRVAVN
jgi:predicted amidohydrolase